MDTRERLLDYAETICRQRGYDGFSYADLAKEVGIRKASIHHHFPTKANLAKSILTRYTDRLYQKMMMIAEGSGHAAKKLEHYIKIYRDALNGGDSLCLCIALTGDKKSLSPDVQDGLWHFHAMSLKWLKARFAEGMDDKSITHVNSTNEEANACLALVEGAQILARAAGDPRLFDQATAGLRQRLRG